MEICEQALKELEEINKIRTGSLYSVVKNCESPIQQMLLVGLCRLFDLKQYGPTSPEVTQDNLKRVRGLLPGFQRWYANIFEVIIEVERDIRVPTYFGDEMEAGYRADLYIYLSRFREVSPHGTWDEDFRLWYPELGRLIIECDGHEFHDRTREQASRDRRRDREMLSAGYPVFRYTGHDIHHKLEDIIFEIWSQLATMAENLYNYYEATGLSPLLNGEYLPPPKDLDVMKPPYADGSPQSIDTQLL